MLTGWSRREVLSIDIEDFWEELEAAVELKKAMSESPEDS
jgi:hypothetical protein